MCPKGDICENCGAVATVEFHWRNWAGKFCDICAPVVVKSVKHSIEKFYDLRREQNATTSVN